MGLLLNSIRFEQSFEGSIEKIASTAKFQVRRTGKIVTAALRFRSLFETKERWRKKYEVRRSFTWTSGLVPFQMKERSKKTDWKNVDLALIPGSHTCISPGSHNYNRKAKLKKQRSNVSAPTRS